MNAPSRQPGAPARQDKILVARRSRLADPSELAAPLERLILALEREDPVLFAFQCYSPAMTPVRAVQSDASYVAAALARSAIEWNFGRDAAMPTHEVVFFTPDSAERAVTLHVRFVCGDLASSGLGLEAELRVAVDSGAGTERGELLARLLQHCITTLSPDFGHIEVPQQPSAAGGPGVGFLTYRARTEIPDGIRLPPGSTETDAGVLIRAVPSLSAQTYADLAPAFERIAELLRSGPSPSGARAPAPPPAVQKPSYIASALPAVPTDPFPLTPLSELPNEETADIDLEALRRGEKK